MYGFWAKKMRFWTGNGAKFVRVYEKPPATSRWRKLTKKGRCPLSSQQKKRERALEKRDRDGYPGLISLTEIYPFEEFLRAKGWHSAVTSGNELLHVYRRIGEEIVVRFDEKSRKTTTSRHGMCLWYDWQIFYKEDERHE